jgi:hypothetical protein
MTITHKELSEAVKDGVIDAGWVAVAVYGAVIAVALVLTLLANTFDWNVDSTDIDGWNRSGLTLRTDHGTGCQYLVTKSGGVTPRIDSRGNPMCGGKKP